MLTPKEAAQFMAALSAIPEVKFNEAGCSHYYMDCQRADLMRLVTSFTERPEPKDDPRG